MKQRSGYLMFLLFLAVFLSAFSYPLIQKYTSLPENSTQPSNCISGQDHLPLQKWGFFGHKRINRMAVFTLPPEMIGFFKKNLEYITEHAVDPDKRRYATKHEAVRHYIDIDHWGEFPFEEVPRDWLDALMKYTDVYLVKGVDTLHIAGIQKAKLTKDSLLFLDSIVQRSIQLPGIAYKDYRHFFSTYIQPVYYEDKWGFRMDTIHRIFGDNTFDELLAVDRFSGFGILPYYLPVMQSRLTQAFRQKNTQAILRISAEMGHYIGDAHVPLHTTENYNGQMTNQVGIHAFWESRLPELFADNSYDFFVGKAQYITRQQKYFWDMVLESHGLLDSVLAIEKDLSVSFPQDRQYCFEERLDITIRTQCKEYCEAYHNRLKGQVEKRMRDAILAIGSSWFTAWVDAGQPDLKLLETSIPSIVDRQEEETLEKSVREGKIKGREH